MFVLYQWSSRNKCFGLNSQFEIYKSQTPTIGKIVLDKLTFESLQTSEEVATYPLRAGEGVWTTFRSPLARRRCWCCYEKWSCSPPPVGVECVGLKCVGVWPRVIFVSINILFYMYFNLNQLHMFLFYLHLVHQSVPYGLNYAMRP